jgi:hypothetical protein
VVGSSTQLLRQAAVHDDLGPRVRDADDRVEGPTGGQPYGVAPRRLRRCGIQNIPPGSAVLALHARVRDVTQDRVADAVAEEVSLLQTRRSLRDEGEQIAPLRGASSAAAEFATY